MSRTYWAGEMRPGDIAVYHFIGKTRVLCNADGTLGRAPASKFASLEKAETYAHNYVAANPDLGCRLYDAEGNSIREIRGERVPARLYTRKDAKRDLVIGAMAFLLIPIGLLIDAWSAGHYFSAWFSERSSCSWEFSSCRMRSRN